MADFTTLEASNKIDIEILKPKNKMVRIPLAGESYTEGNFYYCVANTQVAWQGGKVITTAVEIREVRTGTLGIVTIEAFEEWAKNKKRTDK